MTVQPPNSEGLGRPGPVPGPRPRPAKPRLLQDGRDMFWSLGPLVVGCIVLAGLVGMCSFQPGGSTKGPIVVRASVAGPSSRDRTASTS